MHVDAFFDYLTNNEHPYWTQIPSDPNPISDVPRDGVAVEDDMALRALLPQIKPRRGRRRPDDDDVNESPSQRPRLEPPLDSPLNGHYTPGRHENVHPWSALPDGKGAFLFPQAPLMGPQPSAAVWANDMVQTPLTVYPQSAITPSTRQVFWADEPKSAIMGPKRLANRRHGAKVVSSAWRSGPGGGGKTRGRPPINRTVNDGPFSAFPASNTFRPTSTSAAPTADMSAPPPPPPPVAPPVAPEELPQIRIQPEPLPTSAGPRPARPGRLSLQVPERVGGEIRLATPPLVPTDSGQVPRTNGNGYPEMPPGSQFDLPSIDILNKTAGGAALGDGSDIDLSGPTVQPHICREDISDQTNVVELESYFMHEITTAFWFDAHGNPIPPCGLDEAQAITSAVIENLIKAATTKEAFLMKLAALAGGRILKTATSLRVVRTEECADYSRYSCNWELRYGDICGQFSLKEKVMHHHWKRPPPDNSGDDDDASVSPGGEDAGGGGGDGTGDAQSAAHWQKKYRDLFEKYTDKDNELSRVRSTVMHALKDPHMQPLHP